MQTWFLRSAGVLRRGFRSKYTGDPTTAKRSRRLILTAFTQALLRDGYRHRIPPRQYRRVCRWRQFSSCRLGLLAISVPMTGPSTNGATELGTLMRTERCLAKLVERIECRPDVAEGRRQLCKEDPAS